MALASLGTWGCGGDDSSSGAGGKGGSGGSAGDGGGTGGSVGACHVPAQTPTCTTPPAALASGDLGNDFFEDVNASTGLSGKLARRVTFGDVNGDGFPDFIGIETGVTPKLQHLYVNQAAGAGRTFVETTAESGILAERSGSDGQTALMVAFGDVDNDGDLDLFNGSYSQAPSGEKYVADPNELYLNDGKGHFTLKLDSGVNDPWPLTTSAATFVDYDLDGKLDLFVGNFMIAYPALASYQDNLYKGDGSGKFTLVNDVAGILTNQTVGDESQLYPKPTYGTTACDWNDDGFPDLLTSTYALGLNDLWKNNGDGTFTMWAKETKFAMDDQQNPAEPEYRWGGNTFAAACGDYDNDGDLDVMTAETTHGDYPRNTADRSRILRNGGAGANFVFERPDYAETGINRDLNGTGPNGVYGNEGDHGVSWLDFDNDGLLDLVIEASAYPQSHAWLYHQLPDHTFVNVTEESGIREAVVNSNGLSVDDFDRDGDLDILMGSVNAGQSPPGGIEQIHLYANRAGDKHHFVYITLNGTSSNRLGVGARIRVTAGCLTQTREISGGKGTFGAAEPPYAHFGLGTIERIDEIEVRWPTNPPKVEVFENVAVDQFLTITEGSADLECRGRGQ